MKLDVKLDKDDEGDIKFSMDCDKEFSDIMNECMEGWGIIIRDVITFYCNMHNPTPIHTISFPEKEKPKSSISGKVILEEDEVKKSDDNSGSGDITHTSKDIITTNTTSMSDPVIPDPVGKGDANAAPSK